MRFRFYSFLTIFCFVFVFEAHAQVFMPQPSVGAVTGIGQATVAVPHLQFGIEHAAQLGFMDRNTVIYAGGALPYGLTDWQVVQAAAAWKSGKHSGMAVGILTNRVSQYSENQVAMSYGRQLNPKLSMGATLGYQFVQAGEYGNAGAPLVQVSFIQKLLPELSFGASFSNPAQTKVKHIEQNSQLNLGLHWKASEQFEVSTEASKEIRRSTIYRLGMAYTATERVMLLAGVSSSNFAKVSLGFGFNPSPAIRVDVSSSWHPVLGITPSLGVRYQGNKA